MAGQAERLKRNRLDIPRLAVRQAHGGGRLLHWAGDVGVQDGTDPVGRSIGGIAKAMTGATQANVAPREVLRNFRGL